MATNKGGNRQGGGTSNRGFASMDPDRQREIASEGGKAAHQKGTAHEFTSEEARRAGSMSHGNRQAAENTSAKPARTAGRRADKESDRQKAADEGSRQGSSSPPSGKGGSGSRQS